MSKRKVNVSTRVDKHFQTRQDSDIKQTLFTFSNFYWHNVAILALLLALPCRSREAYLVHIITENKHKNT